MAPYDWANGGSADIFLDGEYGFTSMGSWYYSREWMEFKDKIMLHCFKGREMSAQFHYRGLMLGMQCFGLIQMYTDGLMDSTSELRSGSPKLFPRRREYKFAFQ